MYSPFFFDSRMQNNRLWIVALDLSLDPLLLHLSQFVIICQLLFFQHIGADHNRLEKIHCELPSNEDEGYKENRG